LKTVSNILGVAPSNVHVRATRPADWADGRRHRRLAEDETLVAEIRAVVAELPTYGYRRATGLLRRGRWA
jgi:putative transposase